MMQLFTQYPAIGGFICGLIAGAMFFYPLGALKKGK